ncbi:UNVERIFIED_CONTAM: Protein M3 [Siphonaria sp. JEL0065]|nr:Protein M3 [Siphonaria sp. JEL0065]
MPAINLTGAIVWAACRPVLKLVFVMGIGVFMAKNKVLEAPGSKVIAKILIWVLNPCLLFTNVIAGINFSNVVEFGIMNLASIAHISMGWILGLIVMLLTQPPIGFRYGTILAVTMANCGDVALAIILSVGNNPPFNQGDSVLGVVYVSAYLCFTNLFFFSVGYMYFGKDIESLNIPQSRPASTSTQMSNNTNTLGLSKAKINDLLGSVAVLSPKNYSSRDKLVVRTGSGSSNVVSARVSGVGRRSISASGVFSEKVASPTTSQPLFYPEGSPIEEQPREKRISVWSVLVWLFVQLKIGLTSLLSPANTATIIGLIIASIPQLRAVFKQSELNGPEAPLSFLFEVLQFLGNAAVPLGLMNLGAALGRLDIRSLISYRVITGITICRLIVMPILGIVVVEALVAYGVIDATDKMLRFVLMLEACMPTASSTVYFTQMWHPKGEANAIAGVILVEYCLAFILLTLSLSIILSLLS